MLRAPRHGRKTCVELVTCEEMQKMLAEENIQQSQQAGASSCSMCNDKNWERNQNEDASRQKCDTCCILCQRLRTRSMVFPRSR